MRRWLSYEGPALLDVKVNRMELIMPPHVTLDEIAPTAVFGMKAILNGRADEVVQLLKNNFWR